MLRDDEKASDGTSDELEQNIKAHGLEGESRITASGSQHFRAFGIDPTKAGAWKVPPDNDNRVGCVFIRDTERLTILQDIDDWTVQKLLGGLTDEPCNYDELVESVAVFGSLPPLLPCFCQPIQSNNLESAQALTSGLESWIWIDLAAQMVVQWLPVFQPGLYQSDFGSISYRPASPGSTILGPSMLGQNRLGQNILGTIVFGSAAAGPADYESADYESADYESADYESVEHESAEHEWSGTGDAAISEVVYTLLPPDWRLDSVSNCPNWMEVLERRAKSYQSELKVDAQAVFWGERFWEEWIESVWQFRRDLPEERWRIYCKDYPDFLLERLISEYLNKERSDLGGESPLQVLRSSRRFVDQACQYRRELWVHFGHPPHARALTENTSGRKRLGTVQYRIILDLLKHLLDRTTATSEIHWQATQCDGLKYCLQSMVAWKSEFLQAFPEQSAWSRQERIELEQAFLPIPRQRVPWKTWLRIPSHSSPAAAAKAAKSDEVRIVFDPELPQLPLFEEMMLEEIMLEGTLPERTLPERTMFERTMFERTLGLGDHEPSAPEVWQPKQSKANVDQGDRLRNGQVERDEFMISCETNQRIGNEVNTVSAYQSEVDDFTTVWKHSYLNWDAEWPVEACYSFLAMRLSFLVSEILMELHRAGDREHGEELIQRFSYVQIAAESEEGPAFESAADVFCDLLEELTPLHPDLVPRLADLQSRLWEQICKLNARKDL